MAEYTIPCVKFPAAKTVEVPLPFGISIKSLHNIAEGPPTDCSLVHSLMLQLNPLLSGMACMIKMLKVLAAIKKVVDNIGVPPNPLAIIDDVVNEVAPALVDLSSCFLLIDPCKIIEMVSAILQIIISYLNCLVQAFESIFTFKIGIDLDSAEGNPVLLGALQCADQNAESALTSLGEAIEGIRTLIELSSPLLEIAGQSPIEMPPTEALTPSLEDLTGGLDPLAPLKEFLDALQQIKNTLDAVC